jgi:hypothetical protein
LSHAANDRSHLGGSASGGSASLYVHAAGWNRSILARNNSMPARPYMARLECLGSSSQRSGLPGSSPSRRPRKSGDPPTLDQTLSRTPSMWIERKPTNRAVERRLREKFTRTHACAPHATRGSAPPWWGRSCRLKARGAALCTSSRATCRFRSSMTAASF